ncbi:hypothetical protein C2U41_15055 [Citrobacter freundii complex sp. CFNIH4]|nr:hypothetical protein C2U41_15055 [Citrobacter freundii complex sp. CFNIH4]
MFGVYVITMRHTHKFYVTYCNILKYSYIIYYFCNSDGKTGNDSNLLIVFYVQIMPDDFVMQLHRF